jgi:outer membrane protein
MKHGITLLFALLLPLISNAQIEFNSLAEVWDYALENSVENTIYQLQVDKAISDKKTTASYLYPSMHFGMSGQFNTETPVTPVPGEIMGRPGETVYLKFGQDYTYNTGVTFSKGLFDWQSRYQHKIAKTNVALKETEKALFEQHLKEQTAQVYFATLTAIKSVEIGTDDLNSADSLLQLANDKFQEGLIDALALNQAQINKITAFDRLEQNKLYLLESEYNLKTLLGINAQSSIRLTEELELEVLIGPIDNYFTNQLSVSIFELNSEMAELERKKAGSRFLPQMDVVYYHGSMQYQQDFSFSLNSSEWQGNSYTALSFSVPLFTGFANKNNYSSVKISQNIAAINLQEEIRKTSINDSILYNSYVTSKRMAIAAQESFDISAQNVALAFSKYQEGLISLDTYLNVFDDHLAIENQYFSRLSEFMLNKATIQSRN